MRVLYLDHPESDYLSAQVFLGLCQELGPESVVDYPYKVSFHGGVHTYPHVYETDPGSNAWQTWRMTEGGPVGTTHPFEWMPAQPGREWSRDEVIEATRSGGFDAVILASPRKYNTAALKDLIAQVGRDKLPVLIMIDGEDYTSIRWDLANEFRPRTYFKREMVHNPDDVWPRDREAASPHVRVLPLPLAPVVIRSRVVDDMHAPIDIFMPGGENTPGGIEPWREAMRRVSKSYVFGYMPFDIYLSTAQSARIAVAVRGHSQDSLRSWELLAVEGPMVAVQRHSLIRPYPFIDRVHVAEFGSPEELEAVVRRYLVDEPARAALAKSGHEHLVRHHTPRERARYLLRESGL